MGLYHDNIRRKILDNNIGLTGAITDTIRITLNKTKQGDIASRVIESSDVIPVIFPILKDVPYRRLETGLALQSLPTAKEDAPIEVICPDADKIKIGDLLFRVMFDRTMTVPLVLAYEIVESLGTFGASSMISSKFNVVYHNETLPVELTSHIADLAKRRLRLQW